MARPEPNICSQKWGKARAGAEPSTTIVSVVWASELPGRISRSKDARIILSMAILSGDNALRKAGAPLALSLKTVPRLEVAAVHLGLIRIHSGVATRPTQEERGAERENNHLPIQFRFNAHAFGGRGQSEVQAFSKDHWVRLVNNLANHRFDYFRFQEESRRVGPIAGRDHDSPSALRKMV